MLFNSDQKIPKMAAASSSKQDGDWVPVTDVKDVLKFGKYFDNPDITDIIQNLGTGGLNMSNEEIIKLSCGIIGGVCVLEQWENFNYSRLGDYKAAENYAISSGAKKHTLNQCVVEGENRLMLAYDYTTFHLVCCLMRASTKAEDVEMRLIGQPQQVVTGVFFELESKQDTQRIKQVHLVVVERTKEKKGDGVWKDTDWVIVSCNPTAFIAFE